MKQLISLILILLLAAMPNIHFALASSPSPSCATSKLQSSPKKSLIQKKNSFTNLFKKHFKTLINKTQKVIGLQGTPKTKDGALLWLILLGILGGHLFYLGYTKKGLTRLNMFLSSALALNLLILYTSTHWYISAAFVFVYSGSVFFTDVLLGVLLGLLLWLIILTIVDLIKICKNKLPPIDNTKYKN